MTLQSNQDKDELAAELRQMCYRWTGTGDGVFVKFRATDLADYILARDSKLIQAVLGEVEREVIDYRPTQKDSTATGPIDIALNRHRAEQREAIDHLKKKYE